MGKIIKFIVALVTVVSFCYWLYKKARHFRQLWVGWDGESCGLPERLITGSSNSKRVGSSARKVAGINSRQKQILDVVRAQGGADMRQIANRVRSVSTRTLRRDMTKLEDLRLVRQVGTTRNSIYQLT